MSLALIDPPVAQIPQPVGRVMMNKGNVAVNRRADRAGEGGIAQVAAD